MSPTDIDPRNDPRLDFECDCDVTVRKNYMNRITGVAIRACPICGDKKQVDFTPTEKWEETGQGKAGRPMPPHIAKAKTKADARRKARGPQ